MMDVFSYAINICLGIACCGFIVCIGYLPLVIIVQITSPMNEKAHSLTPLRKWLQFNTQDFFLLVLTLSVVLVSNNFYASVVAIALFLSHGAGKRIADKTSDLSERNLYWLSFGSMFGWITLGATGTYYHRATSWEILSASSWENSFNMLSHDLKIFLSYGVMGFFIGGIIATLPLILHWSFLALWYRKEKV